MRVHVPDGGRLIRTTLPVAVSHVGGVIVPIEGTVGVGGCGFITISLEGADIQPKEFVTVKV